MVFPSTPISWLPPNCASSGGVSAATPGQESRPEARTAEEMIALTRKTAERREAEERVRAAAERLDNERKAAQRRERLRRQAELRRSPPSPTFYAPVRNLPPFAAAAFEPECAHPCPGCNAPLERATNESAGLVCDGGCGMNLKVGERMWCCAACDYDLCVPCSMQDGTKRRRRTHDL